MANEQAPRSGRVRRLNLDKDEDLVLATRSGIIWQTKFAQRGIDAIKAGKVSLAECRNVPDDIRGLLS